MSEISALFAKAHKLQQAHEWEGAIALYKQLLDADPMHLDALHFLGLTYAQAGKLTKALEYLTQAKNLNPEASLLNNLANVYKKLHQTEEAIYHYLQAIALEPEYAQAHNNLASIYAQNNQYQAALAHYIKAVNAAPDFSAAHFNLGLLLLKNNELDAAKTQFNNVLSLNPDATEALFYLGVLHLNSGALDEAKNALSTLLEQDPEHVEALVNLGVIALKNEENQSAVDYFSKALALDNEHIDARNNLAGTFMHHDRFENALMHYDVLLKAEPNNTEYLYNCGVAQMALGHLNEAIVFFEQVLHLEHKHTPSLNNLAAIYLKMDRRETSQNYLEQVLEINPEDCVSRHMLLAITQTQTADTTPDYAQNLFNNYALYYDQHMQGHLNYSVPQHIARTLHQLNLAHVERALDLGCGTGLTGIVLREISSHLSGIDIAEKMILLAKARGIYDSLVQGELIDFLKQNDQHYDLVVAADVLPYFGDLDALMHLISERLSPNGYFMFTTEINEHKPWQLEHSARFSHQPEYIIQLATKYNFQAEKKEIIPARLQNNTPLHVMLYCLSLKKEQSIAD